MKPGFGRAVGAGILGFLGSAVFVIILRALQSIEPVFDAQLALILGSLVSSFAFIWGAGGADPRMSEHPHEPEVDEETGIALVDLQRADTDIVAVEEETAIDETEEENRLAEQMKPGQVLQYSMWQIAFWVVSLVVVVFGFAALPTGLFLRQSNDPMASTEAIGYYTVTLPLGLGEAQMSQLTAFIIFVIVILALIGALGMGLALLTTAASRNLTGFAEEKPTRMTYQKPEELERKHYASDLIIAGVVIFVYIALFDFMLRGAMRWSHGWNIVFVGLAITLGLFFTLRRTQNMDQTDSMIEAIKVNSMTASLVFLFPTLYILHYEVFVGLIFKPEIIRTPASLGGAIALTLILVFVLYNDTVSDIIIKAARGLRRNLQGEPDTETTAIQPVNDTQSNQVEVAES